MTCQPSPLMGSLPAPATQPRLYSPMACGGIWPDGALMAPKAFFASRVSAAGAAACCAGAEWPDAHKDTAAAAMIRARFLNVSGQRGSKVCRTARAFPRAFRPASPPPVPAARLLGRVRLPERVLRALAPSFALAAWAVSFGPRASWREPLSPERRLAGSNRCGSASPRRVSQLPRHSARAGPQATSMAWVIASPGGATLTASPASSPPVAACAGRRDRTEPARARWGRSR